MTRKDYMVLANAVAELQFQGYLQRGLEPLSSLGAYLVDDNPNFDFDRFYETVKRNLALKEEWDARLHKYNPNGLAPSLEEIYAAEL